MAPRNGGIVVVDEVVEVVEGLLSTGPTPSS